ncbi:MAG: hypothetical protein SFU87_01630 [Chitinophagaceae bacterium]|nr:hypothetical protein [Chitinophagaceae bacterium]
MNLNSIALFLAVSFLTETSYGQSDNSVDVIPHWKKDETHSVKIKSTTTDAVNGNAANYLSLFDAKFKVIEATESGYKVEWVYTTSKLADNDPTIENQIIARLLKTKILFKLSNVGQFVELINTDEVRNAAGKAIDELIANSASNPSMNIQYQGAKQLIASKPGLEAAVLKQIKFYNFSFGFTYRLNQVQTNNIKFPNPLGGQPFDAIEKVQLTKLDNKNSICITETNKIIDGNTLKAAIIDYVRKASKADTKTIEEQISKSNLEMSENSMQQIEFSKGIIQKSYFKRVMHLGFQNRTTLLEIETAD